MPEVVVKNLTKYFKGKIRALENVNLRIEDGEYVVLLGPSGCGKTTLLKCIAGIVEPTSGRIFIDGRDVTATHPEERGVGMVFQNYALFPHMNVLQNTMYGPLARGADYGRTKAVAHEMLELVKLAVRYDAYPGELSGGMQQRLSVARALATGSRLLLLDEPLSALDAKIKEELRLEMRKMIKGLGLTAIHVTHDQEEAMATADRIIVMRTARIEQVGVPEEIYHNPSSLFAAHFVGEANFLRIPVRDGGGVSVGEWHGLRLEFPKRRNGIYIGVLRPEKVRMGKGGIEGVITDKRVLAGQTRLEVKIGEDVLIVKVLNMVRESKGDVVRVHFDSDDVRLFEYPEKGLLEAIRVD